MPPGAIAVFPGTLVHGAGANRSKAPRLAYTNQYCEPWVRTQENFFLSIPRERVAAMSPALQSLLGYSVTPPFLGMVTASHPAKSLAEDWVAPVDARRPDRPTQPSGSSELKLAPKAKGSPMKSLAIVLALALALAAGAAAGAAERERLRQGGHRRRRGGTSGASSWLAGRRGRLRGWAAARRPEDSGRRPSESLRPRLRSAAENPPAPGPGR